MRRTETIDRERRWARPAAAAAFGVFVLFVLSRIVAGAADVGPIESRADLVTAYGTEGVLITADVIGAVGIALLAPVLLYLFRAAQARSDAVRGGLVGVVLVGPLFFAAGVVLQGLAFKEAGEAFLAEGTGACATDACIRELVADTSIASVASGLTIAGAFGLAVGLFYTCRHAMRIGLITRFLGTFGMAIGALILVGTLVGIPLGSLLLVFFALGLGLTIAGWRPGGRPPAWEAGEAVPWPAPGERQRTQEDEPVEGRAAEVFPDAATEDERPPLERGSIADEVERASGGGPQKRKKRGR